jgi:hypothetical protein
VVPQSRSGCGGKEKNSQPPPGIEPPNSDRPAHLVTIPTELLRLFFLERKELHYMASLTNLQILPS